MDELSIDFNSLLPYVISAFTAVYGEEYRAMITKKINNALIVSYHDVEGLSDYILYITRCKRRELSIKFLEQIGIDIQEYKKNNYTSKLDDEIENILQYYIGTSSLAFDRNFDFLAPLMAFVQNNNNSNLSILLENKIKLINHLLGTEYKQVTKENFELFKKTNKYLEILKKINEMNLIYKKILLEYKEWKNKLLPYEEYIKYEEKRKKTILQKKKDELFEEIFSRLSLPIRTILLDKTVEQQQRAILGCLDISSTSIVENFRLEQMEKLRNPDIDTYEKRLIGFYQSDYLNSLGIFVPKELISGNNSKEDCDNYLNFLNQYSIRKYIPDEELISYISATRKKKYEEALNEYYTTRKDFTDIMAGIDSRNNFDTIYNSIKNKQICVLGQGTTNENNEFISIMFYTIRKNDGGFLFYNFMHENGHIIDQNQTGCGFESYDDFNKNDRKNPYNKAFRKYEKWNETLNDIFTMEAVEFLQKQGIYLIEPQIFTSLDIENNNTHSITKNLLQPLIKKFRSQIISAKVNANPKELSKYIGEENFEELVDVVNKVDYLSKSGVVTKINTSSEDAMVKDYLAQLERIKQIYMNIDDYYTNHFMNLSTDTFVEGKKTR